MIKAILCSVQNSITLLPDFVDEEKGNARGRVQAGHQTEVRHGVVIKFGSLWIPGSCLERVIPPAYLGAVSSFFCLPIWLFTMVNIQNLIDDAKCFETVRDLRWSDGIFCPHGGSARLIKRGFDDTQPHRQRYHCHGCDRDFDDLTGTVLAGHHQPLRVWILCLYFMGLNLSNRQIAQELGLNKDDAQHMTTHLRQGLVAQQEPASLQGEVECDEVYIVAGHKGHPTTGEKKDEKDDAIDSKAVEDVAP